MATVFKSPLSDRQSFSPKKRTKYSFMEPRDRLVHGGTFRRLRSGRRARPISMRDPIHLVFKANSGCIHGGFRAPKCFKKIMILHRRYSSRFMIKTESMSVQGNHLHIAVRVTRRSNFQNYLRVFAGQIAQQFINEKLVTFRAVKGALGNTNKKNVRSEESKAIPIHRRSMRGSTRRSTKKIVPQKLWLFRPFTRIVKGSRALRTLKSYIALNELEVLRKIPYRKTRLNGLSRLERELVESHLRELF